MDADLEYDPNLDYTSFPNGSRNSGDVAFPNVTLRFLEYPFIFLPETISFLNNSASGRKNNSYSVAYIINICIFIICILGVAGNGIVIWLLGFRVQMNPFITYILNLATADLGLLISLMPLRDPSEFLPRFKLVFFVFDFLGLLMYSTSQFLLTAISFDRCVAVFFPLWHRCHRPPHLSAIVCALMWVLSLVLTTVTYVVMFSSPKEKNIQHFYQFIVNAALCLPLMTISTVALFIKVCFKPQQHRRGKLLTILLLTLSFFLLFASPFNVILIFTFYHYLPESFQHGAMLLSCLNSSVNPVIYFLVGRQRKTRHRETLKMILQRAFKEEEGCIEKTPRETQL